MGVYLLDVPLDGTDLQRGQSGSTHHANEAVSAAVVIHQVLHPPAHLVVPPLVLPRVMAMTRGRGGSPVLRFTLTSIHTLVLLCDFAGWSEIRGGVFTRLCCGVEDTSSAQIDFC